MTGRYEVAALAGALAVGALLAAGPTRAQEEEHGHREAPPDAAGQMSRDWEEHHDARALRNAVLEAVRSFHASLAAGDSAAVLGHLHPEVRVYEGGHAETLEEYRSGHLGMDVAFLADVTRETTAERVVPSPHMALYEATTRMEGSFRDREVSSVGTETLVLVPTEEGWKIRHIHWSSRG